MNEPRPGPKRDAVEFEAIAVRRPRRRLEPGLVLVALAALLVLAGLTRPWGSPAEQPGVVPLAVDSTPATIPTGRATPSTTAVPPAGRWAIGVGALPTELGLTPDATPLPWMYGQIVWSAWRAVEPRPIGDGSPDDFAATATSTATASELCTGLPSLPSRGRVVAVVAPPGRSGQIATSGWNAAGFRDDPPVIWPIPEMTALKVHRSGDITYLSLASADPWPDGRYEFRVESGPGLVLAACLGQP